MRQLEGSSLDATNAIGGVETHFWANFAGSDVPENVQTVVLGNGAFAQANLLRPFIQDFLEAASKAEQPAVFVTYEDPSTADAYTPSQRVANLAKVVLGVSELLGPVHLVGHSWSAVHAANIAAAFAHAPGEQPAVVKSLTLYTPIGYSGAATCRSFGDFAKRCLHEMLSSEETSAAELRALASAALRRFLKSPRVTAKAVANALRADQVEVSDFHLRRLGVDDKLARLQRVPLKAVVATGDCLFPADATQAVLTDCGFDVFKVSGNHQQAITDPANGEELFRIMFDR